MFIATRDDIVSGRVTDIYFIRTKRILEALGDETVVRMEFHTKSLPYKRAIFAGLRDALEVLEGKPVNVYAIPEGTVFYPNEPLMIIEGRYRDFAVFEAALLGILRHYTSVTTKAARIKIAAGDKTVLFFGIRSAHPAIAPMLDRAAYIGGLDGVSGVLGAEMLGIKPQGTMPHALIITIGDPVKAREAFDKYVEPEVPRIALTDTFYDERYESLLAAETLKDKLYGVRLDTPSSRRGNMRAIVKEVRRTLDIHGYKHVKIIVSGGLDEEKIMELRDVADGFGVGTAIARPKNIDISADIVEKLVDGKRVPISKRGKLPGAKNIYVKGNERLIGLLDEAERYESMGYRGLMVKRMENGKLIREYPSDEEIRNRVLEQLKNLDL